SLVGSIFKPAAELIDNLHTSEEEKLQIKQDMFELQVSAFNKAEEYETALLDAKKTIITAEAQSSSWIARNWRPITMLTFLLLVVLDSFGWLASPLAEEAWLLLQIGLSGYVVGRSAEKVTNVITRK
ncbi:MAG: 3TM-type holin, partial [Chloroflexota bacterium]